MKKGKEHMINDSANVIGIMKTEEHPEHFMIFRTEDCPLHRKLDMEEILVLKDEDDEETHYFYGGRYLGTYGTKLIENCYEILESVKGTSNPKIFYPSGKMGKPFPIAFHYGDMAVILVPRDLGRDAKSKAKFLVGVGKEDKKETP